MPFVNRSHIFFLKVPFYQLHLVALIITTLTINFTPLCSFRFLYGLTWNHILHTYSINHYQNVQIVSVVLEFSRGSWISGLLAVSAINTTPGISINEGKIRTRFHILACLKHHDRPESHRGSPWHPFFFNHNAFHPFSIKLVIWNNSSLLGSYLLNPAWEREEAQEAQKTEEAQKTKEAQEDR